MTAPSELPDASPTADVELLATPPGPATHPAEVERLRLKASSGGRPPTSTSIAGTTVCLA